MELGSIVAEILNIGVFAGVPAVASGKEQGGGVAGWHCQMKSNSQANILNTNVLYSIQQGCATMSW